MEWKLPNSMKATFVSLVLLFLFGIVVGSDTAVIIGCLGLIIISVSVDILEAIHKQSEPPKDA